MSNIKGPLISSQSYLDKAKVNDRAARFKRFIVSVYPIVLRGQQYTILMDGHHNYAAAKLAGVGAGARRAGTGNAGAELRRPSLWSCAV